MKIFTLYILAIMTIFIHCMYSMNEREKITRKAAPELCKFLDDLKNNTDNKTGAIKNVEIFIENYFRPFIMNNNIAEETVTRLLTGPLHYPFATKAYETIPRIIAILDEKYPNKHYCPYFINAEFCLYHEAIQTYRNTSQGQESLKDPFISHCAEWYKKNKSQISKDFLLLAKETIDSEK